MSSARSYHVSSTPAAPASSHGSLRTSRRPVGGRDMTADDARLVVRLIQCPVCSYPLRDPYTLPCGNTLCRTCIPSAHLRTRISYPATESRRRGFFCPFQTCKKEHPVEDCSVNVVLNRAVTGAKTAYDKGRRVAIESGLITRLTALATANALLVPKEELPGGRLLATFLMAEKGDLAYHAELEYDPGLQSQILVGLDAAILGPLKEAMRPEVDCQVCFDIFYDPITTPCGHTFCRACLQRTLDHARLCPVCRRELTVDPMGHPSACPSNELLKRITAAFWIDLVEERRSAAVADADSGNAMLFDLPIFICTLAFPAMPTFLHIFEPRYRLMIRRALDENRTFGMVLPRGEGAADLGTVLSITNFEFFADGRILLETRGVSRFRILESSMRDEYLVARAQRINDVSLAEEEELEASETEHGRRPEGEQTRVTTTAAGGRTSHAGGSSAAGTADQQREAQVGSERPSTAPRSHFRVPTGMAGIQTMPTRELMDFAADFVQRMRQCSVRWLRTRTLEVYGECPGDPAMFPWWLANVLPVSEDEKYRLLGTTSVRERLKICCGWVLEWEGDYSR